MAKHFGRMALVAAAALLAACSSVSDRGWIPQAPAGRLESEARAPAAQPAAPQAAAPAKPAAPPAAQPAPARRYEVDPGLVAQGPMPTPRTPAPSSAPAGQPPAALGGYTQATRYGDLLFVSGQIALDLRSNELRGANIEEQTRQVMENIRAILESHRLTMANVVSTTVYLKDLAQFRGMDGVYESYFRSSLPARSVVQVARLPRDALVEISVIAGR
jgi:2-iminobutanoate/2-iminopropanoate deaminase